MLAFAGFPSFLGIAFTSDNIIETRWRRIVGTIIPTLGDGDYLALSLLVVTCIAIGLALVVMLRPAKLIFQTYLCFGTLGLSGTIWQIWSYEWSGEEGVIVCIQLIASVFIIICSILRLYDFKPGSKISPSQKTNA
jgi:hypothetical protein